MAEATLRWKADTAGAIAATEALKRVVASVGGTSTTNAIKSLGANWKLLIPAITAAGVAVLGFTGNLAALAPLVPVLTAALIGLLAPFTTLAALVVGFIPPVTLLVGLLGGLAAAFGFGLKSALTSTNPAFNRLQTLVDHLSGRFAGLTRILAHDFMPIFIFLIGSAQQALNYLDKIAKLPLAEAFKSFATTGVTGLQRFLDHVGEIVKKPLRLAFKVAFGKDDTLRKALVDDWNDIWTFLTKGQSSPGHFIATWFGKQDFTKTGMRWATELAGATMNALGAAFLKIISTRGGAMILGGTAIGAGIGTALGGPIGGALGAAIGSAAGIMLNHYWPQITSAASSAFGAVAKFIKQAIGPKLWSQIISLTRSFWDTLRAVGGFLKNDVYPVIRRIWDKLGGWHTVAVIIAGVIRTIATIFVTIYGDVRTVYNWLKKAWDAVSRFARVVGGDLLSAWHTIAGVVGTIVGAIKSAVGLAERLASALGGPTANPTLQQPGGRPIGGRGGVPRGTLKPATGGLVTGGIPGQDSVPALLTPGEIVLNRKEQLALLHGGVGGGDIYLTLDLGEGITQRFKIEAARTARNLRAGRTWVPA